PPGWHDSPVTFVAFADGGRLVTGAQGWHEPVCVWDGRTGVLRHQFPVFNLRYGTAVLPDGKGVAVVGEGGVKVYDLLTGKERAQAERHTGPTQLVFSPDGTKVTVAERGAAVTFDATLSRQLGHRGLGTEYVTLSPDGRWAATVNVVQSPVQT